MMRGEAVLIGIGELSHGAYKPSSVSSMFGIPSLTGNFRPLSGHSSSPSINSIF